MHKSWSESKGQEPGELMSEDRRRWVSQFQQRVDTCPSFIFLFYGPAKDWMRLVHSCEGRSLVVCWFKCGSFLETPSQTQTEFFLSVIWVPQSNWHRRLPITLIEVSQVAAKLFLFSFGCVLTKLCMKEPYLSPHFGCWNIFIGIRTLCCIRASYVRGWLNCTIVALVRKWWSKNRISGYFPLHCSRAPVQNASCKEADQVTWVTIKTQLSI